MSSDLSKFFGNLLAQYIAGAAMPSPPDIYLALFDGDPKTTGTEVTTTIRVAGRLQVSWDTVANDGVDNTVASDAAVDFGNAAGAANVSHIGAMDAASSGNRWASKALAGGAVAIASGTPVKFNSADVNFVFGA